MIRLFYFIYISALLACVLWTVCMPDAHRGQMSTSDPLKVELWMVVSLCVAKNQAQIFFKINKCF